ncbi:MAG TPA: type II toxin-antitoxin system RelE/ParE family toxin [Thermomicrobiales bacterium]|nr:type II toxin-antitoxin system RelE/ParE family toxin [Thermomicrobiales bacterium]
MTWDVRLVDEVAQWFLALQDSDEATANSVETAIDTLVQQGPSLGRPLVDTIAGSSLANLKELRPASRGRTEIRILFVFDPAQRVVLLVAGDKSREWGKWYRRNIPVAEARYRMWLSGDYDDEVEP